MMKKNPTGERGMLWNYPDLQIERPCSGECTLLKQIAGLEYANGSQANIDSGMWFVSPSSLSMLIYHKLTCILLKVTSYGRIGFRADTMGSYLLWKTIITTLECLVHAVEDGTVFLKWQ